MRFSPSEEQIRAVLGDPSIPNGAKAFYQRLAHYAEKYGQPDAVNSHWAKEFGVSDRTIRQWLYHLQKSGHIEIQIESNYYRHITSPTHQLAACAQAS